MAKQKKQSGYARQKVIQAQHRNDFMRRLKYICSLINPEIPLYDYLPADVREEIYIMRCAPAKAVAGKGSKAPHDTISNIESTFKKLSTFCEFELTEGTGVNVTLSDYNNIVFQLELSIKNENRRFPGKEYFEEFLKDQHRVERYVEQAIYVKHILQLYCTDACKCLYNIHCNFVGRVDGYDLRRRVILEVNTIEPQKIQMTIDGVSRTVCRLEWIANGEPIHLSLPVEKIDSNSRFPGLLLPIYIQQHAHDRMEERVGLRWKKMMYLDMVTSVLNADITRNAAGDLLIKHKVSGKTAGYFRVDLVEGALLIRTYLFLTNNGTPEGKKLEELTGLKKQDKEYLLIDKLDTLAYSDILENEHVCSIFRKAGCQELLELCEMIKNEPTPNSIPEKQIALAERMSHYLKTENYIPDLSDEDSTANKAANE